MCGRFAQFSIKSVIMDEFNIDEADLQFNPSYNISPTQEVVSIIGDDARKLILMQWGLIPSWANDPAFGKRMINARAETITEKPSFKNSFKKYRCLVLADGFYEWRKQGKKKNPVYIYLKSRKPFGFAGIYNTMESSDGENITSCAIITTEANSMLKTVHNRMPVIISKEDEAIWLNCKDYNSDKLLPMLTYFSSEKMMMHDVSTIVNSPANNSEDCIKSI